MIGLGDGRVRRGDRERGGDLDFIDIDALKHVWMTGSAAKILKNLTKDLNENMCALFFRGQKKLKDFYYRNTVNIYCIQPVHPIPVPCHSQVQ